MEDAGVWVEACLTGKTVVVARAETRNLAERVLSLAVPETRNSIVLVCSAEFQSSEFEEFSKPYVRYKLP